MIREFPKNPCALCRKREATQLCDFVVEYFWMSHQGNVTSTCDLPMCKECSHQVNAHDFCPYHAKMLPNLKIKDKTLQKWIIQYQVNEVRRFEEEQNER